MSRLTNESLTIEAFEARMWQRCRMFARSGVSVAALHATQEHDRAARRSVEACVGCDSVAACARWLDAAPARTAPPAFCANRDRITALVGDPRLALRDG